MRLWSEFPTEDLLNDGKKSTKKDYKVLINAGKGTAFKQCSKSLYTEHQDLLHITLLSTNTQTNEQLWTLSQVPTQTLLRQFSRC